MGRADPWKHEIILHRVGTSEGASPNRCHIDITAPDMDTAIEQMGVIGGRLKRTPACTCRN